MIFKAATTLACIRIYLQPLTRVLVRRLDTLFLVSRTALHWFECYLCNYLQHVRLGFTSSPFYRILYGIHEDVSMEQFFFSSMAITSS